MVLTVQNVTEQPSPDPPGAAAAFPERPAPRFEVASLRPCDGTGGTNAVRYDATGRVTGHCATVLGMIKDAWNLPFLQRPAGTPKSFEGNTDYSHVTILAKAPEDVPHDRDNLRAMLRALLIERYKMAVRFEDRPMDTATLVNLKARLTKADPANRTGCVRQIQPAPEGRGRGFSTQTHLVCHNMTMAQFTEQIPAYDTDIFYPVENATGLDGSWDFNIDFDPMASRRMQALRMEIFPAAAASKDGQAVEPTGGISLEDALQKQLGLELKISKKPQPVLVIDHMLEKPIDN
ncbi:MAG TPA: TIGR03435 family protein [Bryobacteraceae bacterium]|nr:TIGR03435 family protein [Bryobacteraceae bacterium]